MNKKKLIKALLAGSMAFGVVGTAAVADLPGLKAEQASAAMLSTEAFGFSYKANELKHNFSFTTDNWDASHIGRNTSWYIKDNNGTIKLSGTSPITYGDVSGTPGQYFYSTGDTTNNLSALPAGSYEILYIMTVGTTQYRASDVVSKAADGTISQVY